MSMRKRLVSIIAVVAMLAAMLSVNAYAEETDVAQIGDTTYATLDEAIEAAGVDGATITILADCEASGLTLGSYSNNNSSGNSTTFTFVGAEGVNPTITFTSGIYYWQHSDLTFKDCTVEMTGVGSSSGLSWASICLATDSNLTLDNVTMTMDGTGTDRGVNSTAGTHAIYACGSNKINVLNGSVLTIKNYYQDALEWDSGDGGYNFNITDSTYISDNNRSGFTGTFYATITNSNVQVINSLGNGSNGSHFIITNSTVDFSNNTSHGLSTGILTVTNSTITANNNGLTGIIFNNKATFVNSDVTITGTKGTSYWNAGMRAYTSNASCTIDADCTFRITDNYVSGIFLDASTSLTIAEGADVVVTGNEAMQANCSTEKSLARSGGGIVVRSGATATLSSTTQIYNNHASVAGDDIYLESDTSSITFYAVEDNWVLNGTYLDGTTHCTHVIDGWYNDGYTDGESSDRWEADAESADDNYISLYSFTETSENEDGEEETVPVTSVTATGILALKAAHGVNTKVSEPGLDKVIVLEDGTEVAQDDVAAGSTVSYKLTSNVPSTLDEYIVYTADEDSDNTNVIPLGTVGTDEDGNPYTYTLTFHDQMDSSLSYNDDLKVYIGDTLLVNTEEATYYTVTTSTTDGCTFEVSMDLLALYAAGIITEEDFGIAEIVVTYTATLPEGATAGTYTNTAWVSYLDTESKKDVVDVDTYGIKIFKYDQDDNSGLEGATFGLYSDESCSEESLVATVTSGTDGYVTINGLDAGTYYLKETEAPSGYVKADTVLEIILPEKADAETNLASVDFANAPIPSTGGAGTTMFTVVGVCILLAAGVIFVISRKKRKDA